VTLLIMHIALGLVIGAFVGTFAEFLGTCRRKP
jgi:hypothetical protein